MPSFRTLTCLACALGLMAAIAPPCSAEDERTELSGVVLDDAGVPLEGVFVMVLSGRKHVPPFIVRPQVFGLPLPDVRVVETDRSGRFTLERVRPGAKTLVLGEEGLALFGVAATRHLQANGEPVEVRFTGEEMESYLTLADRAEEATEVLEDVVLEVDLALGWYMESRTRLREARREAEALLGLAPDDDGPEVTPETGASELPAAWERMKQRLRGLLHGEETP